MSPLTDDGRLSRRSLSYWRVSFQFMTDFFKDSFVQPVEGKDNVFAVRWDFSLEGKAVEGSTEPLSVITETEDGDLIIEGYAAVWDGDDRQGENFAPGTFAAGIKEFLSGQAALCYHHQHDKCLGKVLDLKEEGKGLFMKARVDGSIKDDPRLKSIYAQIKRGTYNGLSTFGYFTRGVGDLANKIIKTDLTEISITPVPVHPGTSLAVVAGKALLSDVGGISVPGELIDAELRDADIESLAYQFESINETLERIAAQFGKRTT